MDYSLIIDIITVIVGLLIVYSGYRKGFIRSIILVVGYILSVFIAIYLSKIISQYLFDSFIRTYVVDAINSAIEVNTGDFSAAAIIPIILAQLPKFIANPILSGFGGEAELYKLIDDKSNGVLENLGAVISDNVVQPIMISLLEIISCLIIFLICTIIVQIIARMFKGLYSIPIVGSLNAVLGGLLGIIQVIILYYIAALVISTIISLTANNLPYLNSEVLRSTYILKLFM